jgi:DNA modification methylase
MAMTVQIIQGDCRDVLKTLPDASVNCCVTSPPYWGLRDYGCDGQLGLERTPEEYVAKMVEVFRDVRRVLRDDGTLWLNLGDSYATGAGNVGERPGGGAQGDNWQGAMTSPNRMPIHGLKPKDLVGIPWRVAFALQADGWYLRQDIIWHKPNPMPESVQDRCTKAHEYIFLLAKSERYFYDADAIAEPVKMDTVPRYERGRSTTHKWADGGPGDQTIAKSFDHMKVSGRGGRNAFRGQGHFRDGENGPANRDGRDMKDVGAGPTRNKRSVWTIPTKPFKGAHFATFPLALVRPCILAGCPQGGTVLDPFGGSGTTGAVAEEEGRNSILVELNPAYVALAERRTEQRGLFAQ